MIQSFSAVTELFLASLRASQGRSSLASAQISSGYRVSQPSDSPDDVITIMDLQARIGHATQVEKNLTGAQSETDASEKALQTAISMMDSIDSLATQALGISQTVNTRASLATQVQQLLQQMVGLSQLNINGRYVFSGDRDQAAQYSYDQSAGSIVWNFQSAQTTQVLDIFGGSFKPALTATEIFDNRDPADTPANAAHPTQENVFAAIQKLYQGLTDTDLASGSATIRTAISDIQAAQEWLNNCLSFYGSVQNRLTQSQTMANQYKLRWTQVLGATRDTDVAAAATELESARTQQQAAMAAYSMVSRQSLFDYLK